MTASNPFRTFGGMCWPAPCEELSNTAHSLTWDESAAPHIKSAQLVAASVIGAYAELITLSAKKRNAIIRELRKGPGKEKE